MNEFTYYLISGQQGYPLTKEYQSATMFKGNNRNGKTLAIYDMKYKTVNEILYTLKTS